MNLLQVTKLQGTLQCSVNYRNVERTNRASSPCLAFRSTVQKHPCINKAKTKRHVKIQHIQVSRNKSKHFPPSQTCNKKKKNQTNHPSPPNTPLTILQTKQENKTEQNKIKYRLQHWGCLERRRFLPFYSINVFLYFCILFYFFF